MNLKERDVIHLNKAFQLTILIGFCLINFSLETKAQLQDNILWAQFDVKTKIDDGTSISFKPIIRYNEDISSYQNFSIDLSLRQRISSNWSFQFLLRRWFLPDQGDRQFLWLDLAYKTKLSSVGFSSHVRWHVALNINDNIDADFVRWMTVFSTPQFSKFKFQLGIEPWFRPVDNFEIQRYRIEPAIKYFINKDFTFTLMYRREESTNIDPFFDINMIVPTIAYNIGN